MLTNSYFSGDINSMKLKKNHFYVLYLIGVICLGLSLSVYILKNSKPKDVNQFFSISLENIEGNSINLSSLKGSKFTVVNFWATWCAPCVEEMPMLSKFHAENQQNGIKVIALAVDNKTQVKKFIDKQSLFQPILIAGPRGSELASFLGSKRDALPYTALIGPKGNLIKTKMGKLSENEIKSWVFNEFKQLL